MRPCGACGAYVDALSGCTHWAPNRSAVAEKERQRRAMRKEAARAARERWLAQMAVVDEFRRMMTGATG